jgi:hypothetical protein
MRKMKVSRVVESPILRDNTNFVGDAWWCADDSYFYLLKI